MQRPIVYYDVGRKDYWILNARNEWITVSESGLRRQLRGCGYAAKAREGERLSEVDQCINLIQLKFGVAYAGPLAGYQKGLVEVCGQRILVTKPPRLSAPQAGEFPTLEPLLRGLLGAEQLLYVIGWL